MKYTLLLFISLLLSSCTELDLNPLAEGSSENWYSNETEIRMSLDGLYRNVFWAPLPVSYSDDHMARATLSDFLSGSFNGQSPLAKDTWTNDYKIIARANTIITNLDAKGAQIGLSQQKIAQFDGEARLFRAAKYANLITLFGDVPYLEKTVDIETAFTIGRTDKKIIIPKVYEDFDKAASTLPEKYTDVLRITKGAALALKARFALYNGDWKIAAEAAKACMDLNIYSLHPSYSELFLNSTKISKEFIFAIPRSVALKVTWSPGANKSVQAILPRNIGGHAGENPSWGLFAAYLCTDGLPIDESPLFDPKDPFKNRDPRCSATTVEFGSTFLGVMYQPHPDVATVMNYSTGKMIPNNDNRTVNQYASFNGLLLKKGVDESWKQNAYMIDPNNVIIRYADLLLIYAEAKIELDQIDQSTRDAINTVRARAYGVSKDAITKYPPVTATTQKDLRKVIRFERRMEFGYEGLRVYDILRWKLGGKTFGKKIFGINYPANNLTIGDWFWPAAPEIDDDAIADFTKMELSGHVTSVTSPSWSDRQYLFPIPTSEILINKNLNPNPGY